MNYCPTTHQGYYPVIQSRSKPEHFYNNSASFYDKGMLNSTLKSSNSFVLRHVNTDTNEIKEIIVDTNKFYSNRIYKGSYPQGKLYVYRY